MKQTIISKITLTIVLFLGLLSQAQSKKWTLEECVNYAIKNNISIKQSELDAKSASIEKSSAIGGFLPSFNINGSHSWNIGLNQNITTGLLENQTTQFTAAGLNSNIDVYNGMQNQNRLRRANLALLASTYQLSKMKDDVSLNIANSFLQILFNKENLKVQKEQLSNNEKQLQRSQELVNAGVVPRGDLLDIKATVASNNQAIVVAENALLISKLSLAQLLQLENFQDFDIVDANYPVTESATLLQTPATIYAKAKEERVELKIAKTNLEIAERDVKIAKGAYQPSIQEFYSFSTRAGYADRVVFDQSGNPSFQPPFSVLKQFDLNKGHSFGFQMNIPVLNGFATKNNVARSKIALDRSKIAFSQQELDLERNIYTAFTDAKGAMKTYESAIITLEARQESFNYAKEKFAVGMLNAFDLNQSQSLFVNAQSDVVRTKYDYIFRVKVIEFYFGIPIIKKQ
ncbi:MAG: TolC family protein [Flavobacterium sp.]|nr:TolC family protein [Flavobacterium sp.]